MTKEPDKHVWESNYHNKSINGIEVTDKNGKVVHFIAIHHNEALHDIKSHRVTIKLDENDHPMLPAPRTFEEIIQAKRRQQMLLYGSGATSSSTTHSRSLKDISGHRTAAAAASSTAHSRSTKETSGHKSGASGSSTAHSRTIKDIPTAHKSGGVTSSAAQSRAPKAQPDTPGHKSGPISPTANQSATLKDSPGSSSSLDPKEVKKILKSAPPGASIVLPNGTVIKKSRRGGARAGAGRKRSRPLPPGQQNSTTNGNGTPAAN